MFTTFRSCKNKGNKNSCSMCRVSRGSKAMDKRSCSALGRGSMLGGQILTIRLLSKRDFSIRASRSSRGSVLTGSCNGTMGRWWCSCGEVKRGWG